MRNATSWFHIDANGYGTAVDSVCGAKYWVLAKSSGSGGKGDLSTVAAYEDDWEPHQSQVDRFQMEAVLLKPGTVL